MLNCKKTLHYFLIRIDNFVPFFQHVISFNRQTIPIIRSIHFSLGKCSWLRIFMLLSFRLQLTRNSSSQFDENDLTKKELTPTTPNVLPYRFNTLSDSNFC